MTLPLWFKEHGYVTQCVGKIFHNWHTKTQGDPRSWSAPEFLHFANHGDDVPVVHEALTANLASATAGIMYGKEPMCDCRDVPDEAYYDGRVAAEAVRVLGQLKDRPFFLAVGFWKPHAPFNAPKKYWDFYDREKLPPLDAARPTNAPQLAFHDSREILRRQGGKAFNPTIDQILEMRHGYFANISYMDAQLGKVLDALDAHGIADRTIIVFVGDHGYHIGEHGLWGKTSNFEYDARVPLFIAAPQKTAGGTSHSLVELIDLFPTLSELCGLATPVGIEGVSLAPVLTNPNITVKNAAFTQHPRPAYYDRDPGGAVAMGVSVRGAGGRYTEWRDWKSGRVLSRELYDEAQQPAELHNRVDDEMFSDLRTKLSQMLHKQFPQTPIQ